jgi:autotransporter-associated beta strand protein
VGVTDLTIAAYPGEYVRFDGAYQLPWIQDTATTWHADVSGLPQFAGTGAWSDWAGTLTSVTAHVVDGFEATNIYPRATCVAGTTAPSGLEGASGGTNPAQTYLSLFRELHDGQRYFVCSNDDSPGSGANYYLFWNAALSKWVISNTLSDDVVDYWSLDTGETDPQSASEYQPHGACCGTIECTRADMTGIPADFTDFPVQTQNSDDALTTYYNDNGTNKLLYDLFYFDWQNLVVYFRSNEVNPITDPDTQLWVKQGQYSDFWLSAVSPPATGVTIEGITFGWGTNIRGVATDCTFSNFTMLGGAIQANISNSLFEQGYFDFLGGDALLRSSGVYEESRYVHDFYINGSGGGHDTIRDTFIGRDLSGSSMSLTEGSDTVYDVVSYGAELGPMVWGTGHMFNFVGINAPYLAQGVVAQGMNDWAWMLWGDSNDEQLDHSYLEITACGAYGVLGDYDTVVATGTEVDDNVVAAEGWTNGIVTYDPFYFMSYGSGVSFSSISNNLFIADRDVGGRFGGGTALQAYSHTAFLDYLAGQGYAGNAYSLDTSDYLDVAAADAFLDSQPSLADAMAYFRGHAAAMAAANGATASQGPVLNLVYGNHPQTVTASTTLELLDDSGQVIIGDEIIDISKNNGALVWGGVSLSLGESQTLLAGDVMYAVTYSGYDNILVCPLTTVTGVSSTAAADAQYTLGGTVPIAVTFSQAVNVSGTLQLALNDGGVANYAGGSGTAMLTFNYVVAVGQETSDLDYASTDALALNGGSIRDLAGNAAVLGLPATCTDGLASLNVTINTGPPTITDVFSSVAADSEFGMDATVPIIVAFSQPVTVDTTGGTPQLALNANSTAAATYVSGSGTDALTFDYAVAAGDATSPLDYTSTAALTLNGGTIENVVGQAANFTLPATRTDGLAAADIVIDSSKTLVVPPADWTSAGLTLALGGAGNLYVTGLSGDVVPPCPPAGVWNIVIAAPDAPTGDLTIDSSNGNPIPAGGLTYCGGGGLIITGGGSLTLSLPNTYTGGTFVSEGVLVAENSAAIPSGSTLSVGPDGSVVLGDPAASEPLALAQTGAGGLQQPDTAGTTAAAAPAPAAASTAAAVQTAAAALAPTLAPVVAAVPAPLVPPATAMAPTTVVVVATTAAEPGRASLDPAPAAIPSSTVSPLPSDRPSAVSRLSSAWLSAVSALSGPLASASWFASAVPYSDAAVPGQPGGQPAAAAAFQVAASGTAASCEATDEALLRLARFPARRAATQAGLEHPAVPRSSGLACETLDLLARSIAKRQ